MNSKTFFALLVACCVISSDFLAGVMAGHHGGQGNNGIELLLAAGILAKLLHKKGHHHHHHGHHHHGHHHGSGSGISEMSVAPSMMSGYSYQPAPAAATTFSSSVEYPPMYPAASQHMPYGGPPSAAGYIGFDPQPMAYGPPMMGP